MRIYITQKTKMFICAVLIAIITIIACGDGGNDTQAHINGNCDNCKIENLDKTDYPTAVTEP
jgi:hypothetical protein